MIKLVLRLGILAAVVLAVGGYCSTASAQESIAAPSTLAIHTAYAYHDILGNGDGSVAVLVRYAIDYADPDLPSSSIDELLAVQLSAAAPVVSAQPFPYVRQGFGQGLVGFFIPAPADIESDTDLTVSLLYFPGGITGADPHETSVLWRTRTVFEADLIDALRTVQRSPAWVASEAEAIDGEGNLTASGQSYAASAIPYVSTLAPGLYLQVLQDVTVRRAEIGDTYAQELQNTGGSARWRSQFNSTAEWLGQPVIMITTIATLILGLIAAYFFQKVSGSQLTTLPVIALSLAGGALVGWVSLAFIGVLAFAGLLVVAFVVILKRAS